MNPDLHDRLQHLVILAQAAISLVPADADRKSINGTAFRHVAHRTQLIWIG